MVIPGRRQVGFRERCCVAWPRVRSATYSRRGDGGAAESARLSHKLLRNTVSGVDEGMAAIRGSCDSRRI